MDAISDPFGLLDDVTFDVNEVLIQKSPVKSTSDSNTCYQCNGKLTYSIDGLETICSECGIVKEYIDITTDSPKNNVARLRIVGRNSSILQSDLYRSNSADAGEMQKKQIADEYKSYRDKHIESGGRAFPLDACKIATEHYSLIQKNYVKRSQNKKAIMASCLWRACLQVNFAPSRNEVASLMQLNSKGIAKGDNFVRSLVSNHQVDIDLNVDICKPEINTLFITLFKDVEENDKKYEQLRNAVYKIIQIAMQNNIGTNSILRSKVSGATYVVLNRCKDKELLSNLKEPLQLSNFCQKRIRKNTCDRFIKELADYHSYFEQCYKEFDLTNDHIKFK